MGQGTGQPQQTVPGVKMDLSNIRGNTRFSDLHEDLQKEIQAIDDFIQKQISFKESIDQALPRAEESIKTIPTDVTFLTGRADTVELALDNDAQAIKGLKELVHEDAEDAKLSFRAIENLKLPPHCVFLISRRLARCATKAVPSASGRDRGAPSHYRGVSGCGD